MHHLIFAGVLLSTAVGSALSANVIVNGQPLDRHQLAAIQQLYGSVRPGSYWYDRVSGLWGVAGGPAAGQIAPGLNIGGPLRANASRGNTGVFVNGRQIPMQEFVYLQQLFGYVRTGRYWLNAQGIGGYEGGPPMFDLRAAAARRGVGGGYLRRSHFGSTGSDGNCFYYLHPNGSSVSNC